MRSYWLCLVAGLTFVQAAVAVTDAERTRVYHEFRELFDARRYQEALPLAQQLVALTEEQYGRSDRALVNPLSNLGTTYYRLHEYPAAEENYLRSVEILEATAGNADRQLLRPIHGLGATYYATGQYEKASIALKRAIDLSRNLDGLFNLDQLAILEPLISSYVALDQLTEAEKEQQYAFRVAENAYGRDDPRMLEPLDRYARWFEYVGRYTTARALHARALLIAEHGKGRGTPLVVAPLRGIARTYRLEFLNGSEEELEDGSHSADPLGGSNLLPVDPGNSQRLNPDGERALHLALDALAKAQPGDHRRRGEILVELGDWHLSGGAVNKGLESYREAWRELERAGSTRMLSVPRRLAYRPPASSVTRTRLSPEDAEERHVELRFTVTSEGRTAEIVEVSSDAPESLERAVISSVKKARYSPRMENGEPVATTGVVLRERLAVRKSSGSA